jgi:hypothetical protein
MEGEPIRHQPLTFSEARNRFTSESARARWSFYSGHKRRAAERRGVDRRALDRRVGPRRTDDPAARPDSIAADAARYVDEITPDWWYE